MSIFRRGEIWYASYSTPGGKRIKESLGTSDKRLATELHDKRKAELWRVDRLGDFPDVTFDDACMRWLEEKAEKKSLKDDRSRMAFWLAHFEGVRLKDVTEQKIYLAVNKMSNRKQLEIWKIKAAAAQKNGEPAPVYSAKPVTTSTKAKHLALMKAILRAAERDWKWLEKAPVIKVPAVRNKRVRWLERDEAKRLIEECPEPLKSVVKFALATGLRRSNIINMEWQQIDMQRRVAWVNPEDSKSNRAIGVALNDTACKFLEQPFKSTTYRVIPALTCLIFEKHAKPCKPIQSFMCLSSVSHHLAIIKLTRACIVDDVGDHTKYRIRDRAPASLRGFLSANLLSWEFHDAHPIVTVY